MDINGGGGEDDRNAQYIPMSTYQFFRCMFDLHISVWNGPVQCVQRNYALRRQTEHQGTVCNISFVHFYILSVLIRTMLLGNTVESIKK